MSHVTHMNESCVCDTYEWVISLINTHTHRDDILLELPQLGAVYTATHCNTLLTWYDCDTLQHTATHCNTLQHTATHCNTLLIWYGCNTLQHTATHCNTLQHTATRCSYDIPSTYRLQMTISFFFSFLGIFCIHFQGGFAFYGFILWHDVWHLVTWYLTFCDMMFDILWHDVWCHIVTWCLTYCDMMFDFIMWYSVLLCLTYCIFYIFWMVL